MTDIIMMDVESAISLHQRMATAVDELNFDAEALMEPMDEAATLLGQPLPNVVGVIRRVAADIDDNAEDLMTRIQMVLAGGQEMNAGLAALELIRANFTVIETRGAVDHADGKLGRGDLEWARHQLDGEVGEAAAWLADHENFFARVETADNNDDYINNPYDNEFAYNPEEADGILRISDIDAFVSKTAAWATLVPHANVIDTAHKGNRPDGQLSRKDFETFLKDYDPTPATSAAIHQVLSDGAYHKSSGFISWGKALDALSFVPVIGDIVDGGRSIYYALHGNWQSASLFALGLVPLPGLSGSGLSASMTVVKNAVNSIKKSGYKQAAGETGKILYKGTTYNWTANTAAEAISASDPCYTTRSWLAKQIGVDINKIDDNLKKTTGEDIGTVKNRLADATGHDLGIMDGFFSDTCEVIARRVGEHQLSKTWLPAVK